VSTKDNEAKYMEDTAIYSVATCTVQEELKHTLMASSVSGTHDYSELCVAVARNEEHQLSELAKRHHYRRLNKPFSKSHII